MLYSVIKDKNLGDGIKDVMVKGEDASKLQRVFDIMGYGDVDRDNQTIVNEDKKKQASRQEPESQRSRPDHTDLDKEPIAKQQADKEQADTKTEKNMPVDKFDMQPDPVNGLDGKDPNELPPTNKKELAEQLHGKSISTRKNLAEGYIQSKDQLQKPKSKTIQRDK